MDIHVVGLLVLAAVFVVGTARPIPLGALGVVAAFVIGSTMAGETADEIVSGFPVNLLILIVGVTYLFAIARANGTIDYVVGRLVRAIRGNRLLAMWVLFVLTFVPTALGSLGPASVAMIAPIAVNVAERYGFSSRTAGLIVMSGSSAGNFSPLNPLGVVVTGASDEFNLDVEILHVFLANVVVNLIVAVVVMSTFARREAKTMVPVADGEGSSPSAGALDRTLQQGESLTLTLDRAMTLTAILVVAVLAMGFDFDIGLTGITAAVVLHLAFPKSSAGADAKITWGVVFLVGGIVMYVSALQRFGTIDYFGDKIAEIGTPLMAAFLLALVAAIVSALASSTGTVVALLPLAVPFLATGELSVLGMVVAITVCATVVDASPFSSSGAMMIANTAEDKRETTFRGLLTWGALMVAVSPVFMVGMLAVAS